MKKIFVGFIVFALITPAFAGCSGNKPEQSGHELKTATSQPQKIAESQQPQKTAEPKQSEKTSVSVESKDGSISYKNSDGSFSLSTDKSVELPNGYPCDKFPVYEGSFIYSAFELNGSYVISAFSKDEVNKVIEFYGKVLEGAKVNMDTKTSESLTSMGTKSGYAYTLDIGKSSEEDYLTSIAISLQPAE